MKRIGVFGGTFDPVHNGHVELARQAIKECELDELIVVPVNEQPLKLDRKLAPNNHRFKMLELAFNDDEKIAISMIEMEKGDVSYTIDTLRLVKQLYENTYEGENVEVWFVVGIDAFSKVEFWKDADNLLKEFPFIIGTRPGYKETEQKEFLAYVRKKFSATISTVDNAQIPISSTEIKTRLRKGESFNEAIPAPVVRYIIENGLYIPKSHIEGVCETAKLLAKHYGADEKKAEFAALYHDRFKYLMPEELVNFVKRFDLDKKYENNIDLAHSKIAAEMMKCEHGVSDEDVINAVKYHTTGRAGMSLLEKILYIADVIEPGRDYPGVEKLRELAYKDLDSACLTAMENTVEYVRAKGNFVDEDTLQAIEWFRK